MHLAVSEAVKFFFEVGTGGAQKIENILHASWSRTLLGSYNMNLICRSITVGGYESRFRFRALAFERYPLWPNTSYNVCIQHIKILFLLGVFFYF